MPGISTTPESLLAITAQLPNAPLSQIADLIRRDWLNPSAPAIPYLQAMLTLPSISDNYCTESGKSIVLYFLANASTYRGPVAKLVKLELNRRVKAGA